MLSIHRKIRALWIRMPIHVWWTHILRMPWMHIMLHRLVHGVTRRGAHDAWTIWMPWVHMRWMTSLIYWLMVYMPRRNLGRWGRFPFLFLLDGDAFIDSPQPS